MTQQIPWKKGRPCLGLPGSLKAARTRDTGDTASTSCLLGGDFPAKPSQFLSYPSTCSTSHTRRHAQRREEIIFFSTVQGVFPRLERHFHDPTKSTSPCPEALRLWSYSQVVFPVGKTREDVFSSLASILERMENVSYDFR